MERPVAIAAVVRRGDGRYLIIRRADGIPAAGYWTPVTGRVEPGETLAHAVEREVLEEVGLVVRACDEVHRGATGDGSFSLVWIEATPDPPLAPGAAPSLSLKRDEVAEARWASAEEALALSPMFPATRAFFERRL